MFSLDGKVVAVVGAGGGIGEAVAVAAGAQGAHVACFDINEANAAATAAKITAAGGKADAAVMDLGDEAQISSGLTGVASAHGRLDGLVCTPAINVRKPILQSRWPSSTRSWTSTCGETSRR
ncbi:MAG: SDR family NAD(P)-dependent oxidoreductase [Vicinamibacterales bacterium]